MVSVLDNKVVSFLGGDKRDIYIAKAFLDEGAIVKVIGMPESPELVGVIRVDNPINAVNDASVIVAPISGMHADGTLRISQIPIKISQELMDNIRPGAVFIIGLATQEVSLECQRKGIRLVRYMDNDEVAILNSIPSAEGAIQMIIEETPITIHGANIILLGYGRTGLTLAQKLQALSARVTVFARKPRDVARAIALGLSVAGYNSLEDMVPNADVIVNTVPTMILPRRILEKVKRDAFILDLASTPGGVDFTAAEEFGIKALLAPGLPGKVAPKTAGLFLAKIIPRLAKAELDLGDN